nr:immunoglobulin heavy chain junction region [Mus musculus]
CAKHDDYDGGFDYW